MMLRFCLYGLFLLLVSCGINRKELVGDYFSKKEEEELLIQLMPYLYKHNMGVTFQDRFSPKYNSNYAAETNKYEWKYYYKSEDGWDYIVLYKKAISLYDKKVGVGCKLKIDKDSIVGFEEVFYTPKQFKDSLDIYTKTIWENWLETKSIDAYVNRPEYIEFPNKIVYYDKNEHSWKMDWSQSDTLNSDLKQ